MTYYKDKYNNLCSTSNFKYTEEELTKYSLTEITEEEYKQIKEEKKKDKGE